MKNLLFLGLLSTSLLTITSCGDRSKLYENMGPTVNTQGLSASDIGKKLANTNYVCDRFSKDGCMNEVLLMGKLNKGKLQTCAAFFVGDNTIATASKCLPRKGNDETNEQWLENSCAAIAFKDLKGFTYTCNEISIQSHSNIALITSRQSSKVGFLEVSTEGVTFGSKNKTIELSSFRKGDVTNYTQIEGRYTKEKKFCDGLKDSLITTLSESAGSKNFFFKNCANSWNSTGSPVINNGKVAALLFTGVDGNSDFGSEISDRSGVSIAENLACQTALNSSTPTDCDLHHNGHKRAQLANKVATIVSSTLKADHNITIFRKDSKLLLLETPALKSCYTEGEVGSMDVCKVSYSIKDKYTGTYDTTKFEIKCEDTDKVKVNWKFVKTDSKNILVQTLDDYTLSGYHTDSEFSEVSECL